jgi:hypothetical protein
MRWPGLGTLVVASSEELQMRWICAIAIVGLLNPTLFAGDEKVRTVTSGPYAGQPSPAFRQWRQS